MLVQIKAFFDFIGDKHITLPGKVIFVFCLLVIFIFLDWMTNFTQNYEMNQKLGQLEQIDRLKDIYVDDSTYIVEMLFLERDVLSRRHYLNVFKNNINDTVRIVTNSNATDLYTKTKVSFIIKDSILTDNVIIEETITDSIVKAKETAIKPTRTVSRNESISSNDIRNIY